MAQGTIESSPLWQDVQATILSGPKVVKSDYAVMVHTEKADFPVVKLLSYEEYADYESNIGASLNLVFQIGLGDYFFKLYPFRANLEISVKKTPQLEDGGTDTQADVDVRRFKAILKPGLNPELTGTRIPESDYQTMNISHLVDVYVEIQDRDYEPLRVKTFPGGTFRKKTVEDIMYAVVLGESRNVLVDGKSPIDGIDIVKPDNTEIIENIIIPSGMKAAMVPTYLQEKSHGVYNAGMGTFFQRYNKESFWFVYSLYDPTRFDDGGDRLVIFAVPKEKMPGIDRTYRKAGKVTYIVATGDRSYQDTGNLIDLNQGVGFRMADAGAMMKKPIVMTEDGPQANRTRLNTEITGRDRQDGNYYAPVVSGSANHFRMFSELARRQLARLEVAWENSESDLIYPGMPCKYVFMDKDQYQERRGVVIGKYSVHGLIGKPTLSNTYRSGTHLSIMLEQFMVTPEETPAMDSPGKF